MTTLSSEAERLAAFLLAMQTHLGAWRDQLDEDDRKTWDDYDQAADILRRIPELESSRLAPSVHEMNYRAAMTALENVKAERDQLREAIKKQSNAVALFQKSAAENARHFADANLKREADLSTAEAKSVAEANAILTAENDQLRAALEELVDVMQESMGTGGWVPTPLHSSFMHAMISAKQALPPTTQEGDK